MTAPDKLHIGLLTLKYMKKGRMRVEEHELTAKPNEDGVFLYSYVRGRFTHSQMSKFLYELMSMPKMQIERQLECTGLTIWLHIDGVRNYGISREVIFNAIARVHGQHKNKEAADNAA